jgi:hypothetical protein
MSILAKTFEQLMLQWDLVRPHNWGFPSLESSFDSSFIIVLESVAESSILPLFIAYSILLTILTTSCQSSNVVVVICGLVETFQQPSNLGSTQKHAAPPLPMCAITRCLNWKRKWWIWSPFVSSSIPHWQCSKQTPIRGNSAVKVQCLLLFFLDQFCLFSLLLLFHADTSGRKL